MRLDDLTAFVSLAKKASRGPLEAGDRAHLERWLAVNGATLVKTMASVGETFTAQANSMEIMGAQIQVLSRRLAALETALLGVPTQVPEAGAEG